MKSNFLFLVTVLFFTYQITAQNVINVDNSTGSNTQYKDLQDAINAASDKDIIYIQGSETSYGEITINKSITLIGFSHSDPDRSTFIDEIILGEKASNSKFSGLHIIEDFVVKDLNTKLTGLIFENNIVDAMIFQDTGVDNMIIRGNVIKYIGDAGTHSQYNNYTNTIISNNVFKNRIYIKFYQSVTIKNNIFFKPNSGGWKPVINNEYRSGTVTVQNCIFYSNGTSNMNGDGVAFENCLTFSKNSSSTTLIGTNNLDDIDPLFLNSDDTIFDSEKDDFHLKPGSPAIGTGVDGGDIGIYNSDNFTFNNFGFTADIPSVKIKSITTSVKVGEPVKVTIESSSN